MPQYWMSVFAKNMVLDARNMGLIGLILIYHIDGISVKHFLSRGQQKLLICAMILAQGMLLTRHVNKGLIYLVDDLPSELDFYSKQKLISLLSRQQTQIFITAIESQDICEFINDKPNISMKVFHVEHGNVVSDPANA